MGFNAQRMLRFACLALVAWVHAANAIPTWFGVVPTGHTWYSLINSTMPQTSIKPAPILRPVASSGSVETTSSAGTGRLPLLVSRKGTFTAVASIGTMTGRVRIDTGSPWTWVRSNVTPGVNCSAVGCYDWPSTTTGDTGGQFNISYVKNENILGFAIQGPARFGDLTVNDATFGVATGGSANVMLGTLENGILGLGPHSNDSSVLHPILDVLLASGQLSSKVFSTYFDNGGSYNSSGFATGELVLGAVEPERFTGSLSWVDTATDRDGWWIACEGVALGSFSSSALEVLVDTGTHGFLVPQADADAILTILGATPYPWDPTENEVDCANLSGMPNFTVSVAGLTAVLSPQDYTYNLTDSAGSEHCLLLFETWTQTRDWAIGAQFLSKYYVAFDVSSLRVGLAPLS